MIPTTEICFEMMDKYGMLDNIKAHSIVVEKVASRIGIGLREAEIDISLEKISAGALMHDIGKTLCLNTHDDHALRGSEICIHNNFREIAEIVGEHIRLKDFDMENPTNEKEIIYYSDKRVNHDVVVSLEERLIYLLERYAGDREDLKGLIKENFLQCKEVEKKIFSSLDFGPEELAELIL